MAAGASRVLLFGSVADDAATVGSDIDLVAVFDDIDYSRRHQLKSALSAAAVAAVGRDVDVFVTDRAEWRRRTREVSASFEAGIAPRAVVLVDRPAGPVRWDKEIGLPDNNTDEALGRLDEASKALTVMTRSMRPDDWEILEPRDNHVSLWRMMDICSAGALAVETSLKALAAACGTPAPHKHRIDLLVPLAGERDEDVRAALADLASNTLSGEEAPYGDLTIWRRAGTYIADRPDIDLETTSALAPRVAGAAVAVCAIAADEMSSRSPEAAEVARARPIIRRAADTLEHTDLLTGERWSAGRDPSRDYGLGY